MTRKVYFKAQNVLSSPIQSGIKDKIILTPDFKGHVKYLTMTRVLNLLYALVNGSSARTFSHRKIYYMTFRAGK